MRVLTVFSLISVSLISFTFCSFLTSEMSLRQRSEPIDSLKSMSESKIEVIFWENMINQIKGLNIYMDAIIEKSSTQKNVIKFQDKFDDKWLRGLISGKYGIYLFEIMSKMTLSQLSLNISKMIFLDEFSQNSRPSLAFRRELNKDLKELLNYR